MALRSFLPLSWKGRSVAYESSIDGQIKPFRYFLLHIHENLQLWLGAKMRNCSKLLASLFKGRSVAYESSIDGPAQQSRLSAHFSPNIFLHGWLSLRLHKDIYQKYKYKYTSMFLPKLKKLFILVTPLRWWDVLVTWNWDNNRKHCLQTFLCCLFFSLHHDCQVIVIIIAAPPAPFMYSAKARQPSHAMQTVANLRSISSSTFLLSSRSSSP